MEKTITVNLYKDHQQPNNSIKNKWIELAKKTYEAKQLASYYKQEEQKLLSQLKALSDNKSTVEDKFAFTKSVRHGTTIMYKH